MKGNFFVFMLVGLWLLGLWGCVDVVGFSEENEVLGVRMVLEGDGVVLDRQEILSGSEGRIVLTLKGQLESFPLSVLTDFELSKDSKILYDYKYREMKFLSLRDSVVFQVVSQCGLPKRWTVLLRDGRSGATNIVDFKVSSYKSAVDQKGLVRESGVLYARGDTSLVEVYVDALSDAVFPLEIVPSVKLSDHGRFIGYTSGTALRFDSPSMVYDLKVEAENRGVGVWRVCLRTPDSDDVNVKGGSFLWISDGLSVLDTVFEVDTVGANVLIGVNEVTDWNNMSMLVHYRMSLPVGARMEVLSGDGGDMADGRAVFNRIYDVCRFKVVSQSGRERIWKMKLGYAYDRGSNVESFRCQSYEPSSLVDLRIDPLSYLDTLGSVIRLDVHSGVKLISSSVPLRIMSVLKLSGKARMSGDGVVLDQGVYRLPEICFRGIDDVYRFRVFSESGEEREWRIVLVDKQKDKSGDAGLSRFIIHKVPDGVVFTDAVFAPVSGSSVVQLMLKEARFPFLLEADSYSLVCSSEDVQVVGGQKVLSFASPEDRRTIRLEAANGDERVWTVGLGYQRGDVVGVASCMVKGVFPDGVRFDKLGVVDSVLHTVLLNVTDASLYFPLRVDVDMVLRGKVSGGVDLGHLTFKSEGDVFRFNVVAESGRSESWCVSLVNRNVVSDRAELAEFTGVVLSEGIRTGVVRVSGSDVVVPVYGDRGRFPLLLDVSGSKLSPFASLDQEVLSFSDMGKRVSFSVVSQSGLVRNKYTVSLADSIGLSDSADIRVLEVVNYSPLDYFLPGGGVVGSDGVDVEVYGKVTGSLRVEVALVLSSGARLEGGFPAGGLLLGPGVRQSVTVVSESGRKKKWTIGLKELDVPKNTEGLIEAVEARNGGNVAMDAVVKPTGELVLYAGGGALVFPFRVHLSLGLSRGATVRVLGESGGVSRLYRRGRLSSGVVFSELDLVFERGERKRLVVQPEDGSAEVVYTVDLGGMKTASGDAAVTNVKVGRYFPLNMVAPTMWVEDAGSRVVVSVAAGTVFPFSIYPKFDVSSGAVLSGLNVSEMKFDRGFSGSDFTVTAEDGTVRRWRLVMEVAKKSSRNDVTGFTIQGYTPSGAGLGIPVVDVSARVVRIPVGNWVKGERLNVEVKGLELSANAVSDFRGPLFFLTAKDVYRFTVTAENGDVAVWQVVLDYVFSKEADFVKFDVLEGDPLSVVFTKGGIIDRELGTVTVDVLRDLTFPFTIRADMFFSSKSTADLLGVPDNRFRFNAYTDVTKVRVTAEDESVHRDWLVKLRYHFSDAAAVTSFTLSGHVPGGVKLGVPATEVVGKDRVVWVDVADWGGETELKVSPVVVVSANARHDLSGDLLFMKRSSEEKTFTVTAESGRKEVWTVRLRYEESGGADVTDFGYASTEPSAVDFTGHEIDRARGLVTLRIAAWRGETVFRLKGVTCKVSANASVTIPSELTFTKLLQESFTYDVRAQDGTVKKWTIKLAYNESGAADITRFWITGSNQLNVIKMSTEGSIGDGEVTIELTGGVRDAFAGSVFELTAEVTVSDKAKHGVPSLLRFTSVKDVKRYKVTAENGFEREWTIRFVNRASADADLLGVRGATIVGSPSGDLKVDGLQLTGRTIRMNITDVLTKEKYGLSWPTLSLDLSLQLSAGAAVSSGGSTARVSVKLDDVRSSTVKVVADNGEVSNVYSIEFSYRPQLDNWDMETWRDGNTPGGSGSVWATANTSMAGVTVNGTNKTDGRSGSGALMYTSETMGKIAAGTIFAGKFVKGSIDQALNDPEGMTHFGVLFAGRPKRIKVDVKYRIGNGSDKGHIWAALEYWPNPTDAKNGANKRCAYGELILSQNVDGWTTYTIDLLPIAGMSGVVPTHICFVAASSKDGNKFIGAKGSELRVDNVVMEYE